MRLSGQQRRPYSEHTGFLTGTIKREELSKDDFRLHVPRFEAEACHHDIDASPVLIRSTPDSARRGEPENCGHIVGARKEERCY